MVTLAVEPLTSEAFSPFGRVVDLPGRDHDAAGPGWRWWAETALLDGDERPWGVGYLDLEPAPPRFDWAERHARTLEGMFPLSGEVLVYVGPPEHPEEPSRIADHERFRVFRVPLGAGVIMDRNVWHGAPLATSGPARALVLILEGTGQYDVTVVRFPEAPVEIGGATPASERGAN